jgi:hypothetical protein
MTAFVCRSCPRSSDLTDGGCPAWWETIWQEESTGEVRSEKSCAFTQLPQYLNMMAREARGAAVSAQQSRDALNRGTRAIALTLNAMRRNSGEIAGELPNFDTSADADRIASDYHDVSADCGSIQSAGLRDDDSAPNGTINSGTTVSGHDAGHPDLVERDHVG